MADPFDALRAPLVPIEPDPDFAGRLRRRIQRSLDLPKGVTVSNLTLDPDARAARADAIERAATELVSDRLAVRGRPPKLSPYLAVSGAARAIAWYIEVLGARPRGDPYVMPDGSIGHAELEIGGGVLMLSEQSPAIGVVAPLPGEAAAVTLHLEVDDVDELLRRALDAGATNERAPADYDYGRNAVFRDPFGHRWLVSSEPHAEPATPRAGAVLRQGDIAYVSLWLPDVARASVFYAHVLGWHYRPASGPQGLQVEGLSMHHGLWSAERSTLFLCFAVDDVHSAAERVRSSGGTAEEPHAEPYGLISECTDDQGVRFALFEAPGGSDEGAARAPANGAVHGDLAYVTMEVVDSARARAFYGSVLGWRFAAGHVEDGWQVEDTVPMVGLSGGHPVATTLPMYRVDDITPAVEQVRSHGGTATDPEPRPYGVSASCTDDQGTRFYLGQLPDN